MNMGDGWVARFVLVTGARTWWRYDHLAAVLFAVYEEAPDAWLVHGDCPESPDTVADLLWRCWGGKGPIRVPAGWGSPCRPDRCTPGHRRDLYGQDSCPAAGQYRNEEMVNRLVDYQGRGHLVTCLAFITPESRGARRCADYAREQGLTVTPYYSPSRAA